MGSGAKGKGKEKEPRERKKPGRVPTSCAECRRLKLRCDRNVPCEKCVSRGCGSICPDGSLTPGKGNRLILANTEELHEQIDRLRYRNRELENALRQLQEGVSGEPHPLLRTDVLQANFLQGSSSGASTSSSSKSPSTSRISPITHAPEPIEPTLEEVHSTIDAFGTILINRRGHSAFLGRSARPEYMLNATTKSQREAFPTPPRISKRMLGLSFPESQVPEASLISDMLNLLPSQSDGLHLCDVYLEYGKFLYSALPRKELLDEIFAAVYRTKHLPTFELFQALSLLFIVFALATLFNPSSPPFATEAHEYFYLSRAAFNLAQPSRETTLATIQTLIHTAQYVDLSEFDAHGQDSAWMYVGQALQLGYSIGLHLNSSRWKLPEEVVQRRQELFWQLFVADTWASFHTGRPPRIAKSSIDCPHPQISDDVGESSSSGNDFHSWFTKYTLLLHSIMESALGPKQPIYSAILDFDRKIRDFPVPSQWRTPTEDEGSPPPHEVSMYRWLVLSAKETALLNLHRMYLGHALQESPAELHRHRYVPSAVAVYRSAWRLIHGLAVTWRAIPKFLARVNLAWSHGLSAALVMCLLVTRSPTSHLTTPALEELDNLTSLFDAASSSCRSAAKFLPPIQVLRQKARDSISPPHTARFYHHHHDMLGGMNISSDSSITIADLDRLNGKTHLVSDAHSSSGTSNAPTPMSMIASTSATSSTAATDGSRATSVTISDSAEMHHRPEHRHLQHTDAHPAQGHPGSVHPGHQPQMAMQTADDNLHPTLAQDIREFSVRSSVPLVPRLSFYDHPSELQSPVAPPPPPPASQPPPHPHGHTQHQQMPGYPQPHSMRQAPPDPPRLLLPPYPTQPQASMFQHHMSMQMQMSQPTTYYPPPQPAPAPYIPGFAIGGGPGIGTGSGFGGWGGSSPFVLDSSWITLVEQLGF